MEHPETEGKPKTKYKFSTKYPVHLAYHSLHSTNLRVIDALEHTDQTKMSDQMVKTVVAAIHEVTEKLCALESVVVDARRHIKVAEYHGIF